MSAIIVEWFSLLMYCMYNSHRKRDVFNSMFVPSILTFWCPPPFVDVPGLWYEFGQMVSDLIHYYCKKEPNSSSLDEMIADSLRLYYCIWNTNLLSTYLWLGEYFSCRQVLYGREPIIQWKCEKKCKMLVQESSKLAVRET